MRIQYFCASLRLSTTTKHPLQTQTKQKQPFKQTKCICARAIILRSHRPAHAEEVATGVVTLERERGRDPMY